MDNEFGDKKYTAYVMYIFSLLMFGTNGIFVSQISLPSSQIVFMRTVLGGALLIALVLLRGGFNKENIKKDLLYLVLGGSALGMNWVALFEAYKKLNVSLATLIYYVGPILVLLFSPFLFQEKLNGKKSISVLIVSVGLICISGSIVVSGLNSLGFLAAIISALFYASLIVFNKRITHTNGLQTAAIELVAAFVVVFVYTVSSVGIPCIANSDWPYIAVLGFINTGLAYLFYFSGVQKLSGQSVALISYLDPVSALLFSALFLHEVMSPIQFIGAVMIIGGAMFGEL